MAKPLRDAIVYGPLRSRRLGRALGVNLLPAGLRICNLNCAYCESAWTHAAAHRDRRARMWPDAAEVERAVADRLLRAALEDELLDRLAVAGHGEPTLHPDFPAITERLAALRDRVAPGLKLAVLSNSTTASWADVRHALARYDERHMKLDAGDPITFTRLNGPGPAVEEIIDGLRGLPPFVVHATFVADAAGGGSGNAGDGPVAEWLGAIERVRPLRVGIGTLGRGVAWAPGLRPVAVRRLREIAEHVRAAGVPAEVFEPRTAR